MIKYRLAKNSDWAGIATLHAKSWQENYRGSMTDDYLDNHVVAERREMWAKRFNNPNEKMQTIVAENQGEIIGLSCMFLDADPEYGNYLDNLHVHLDYKRKGIGKKLMKKSAELLLQKGINLPLYLWVIIENNNAIRFYEDIGGVRKDQHLWKMPDNGSVNTYRYVWYDLEKLANLE